MRDKLWTYGTFVDTFSVRNVEACRMVIAPTLCHFYFKRRKQMIDMEWNYSNCSNSGKLESTWWKCMKGKNALWKWVWQEKHKTMAVEELALYKSAELWELTCTFCVNFKHKTYKETIISIPSHPFVKLTVQLYLYTIHFFNKNLQHTQQFFFINMSQSWSLHDVAKWLCTDISVSYPIISPFSYFDKKLLRIIRQLSGLTTCNNWCKVQIPLQQQISHMQDNTKRSKNIVICIHSGWLLYHAIVLLQSETKSGTKISWARQRGQIEKVKRGNRGRT